MKILFLTNIPAPYRVKFFSSLGLFCDLTVLYEMRSAKTREKSWLSTQAKNYREIYMRSYQLVDDGGISIDIFHYLKKKSV